MDARQALGRINYAEQFATKYYAQIRHLTTIADGLSAFHSESEQAYGVPVLDVSQGELTVLSLASLRERWMRFFWGVDGGLGCARR